MSTSVQPSSQLEQLAQLYEHLKERFHLTHTTASSWLKDRSLEVEDFRTTSQKMLAATGMAGAMALHSSVSAQVLDQSTPDSPDTHNQWIEAVTSDEHQEILDKMKKMVSMPPGQLDRQDELYLEQQLTDMLGFEVVAQLDGVRLNHTIGIMGGEQHLRRFPTDTLEQHDSVIEAGIAPNRGAFGWFTDQGQLTSQAIEREKYYIAAQTMYLPTWNQDHAKLKPWFKFRKMIVLNPAEEVAMVVVVGDAGPGLSVKKQFGGSPEVMREGKIWTAQSRGRVMVFFVDDPEDVIPLGLIELSGAARRQSARVAARSTQATAQPAPAAGASAVVRSELDLEK